MKPTKPWSLSVGPYGARIRLSEAETGIIYADIRDPTAKSGYRTKSLRHRDRKLAERWAKEQSAKLAAGDLTLRDPTPVASRILGLYLKHHSPTKKAAEQQADQRRADLWLRFLGPKYDLSKLRLADWQAFIEARRSGAINASGKSVPEDKRVPVRINTVAGDLVFLRGVINWACKWQDDDAHYLMRDNPTRGFPMPVEKNPRRPIATADRYEKVRAVAEQVTMAVGRGRHAPRQRSPLWAILDLAYFTGRRISAILGLKRDDLELNTTPTRPFGAIRWRAETDKCGREWVVPMSREVRAVIDRLLVERGLTITPYLFEAPNHPGQPISKEVAGAWLIKAEQLAGVPKQKGSLWHAYRRGWATARKHMPDVDVAAAGGWSDLSSLKTCYQHADEATMYAVVSHPVGPVAGVAGAGANG